MVNSRRLLDIFLVDETVELPREARPEFTEPLWETEMVRWLSTEARLWVGDEPGAVPIVEMLEFLL